MKICKTVLLAVFFMGSATLWAEDRPVPSDPADPLWKSIPEVVATVKGKPIPRQDFIKTFTESLPDGKLPPEATAETVAQVAPGLVKFQVARILLEPKFAESGIKPSVERSRDIIRKELDSLSPNDRKALAAWLMTQNETIDQFVESKAKNPKLQFQHAFREFAAKSIYRGLPAVPGTPSREEMEKLYRENLPLFKMAADPADSVRTSHILVAIPRKASKEEKEKAKAKAQQLLAEVRKDPKRFEEIARRESDCPTAAGGGSVEPFRPKEKRLSQKYEAAAVKLKQGEISDVVEDEFGFHLIRRDALRPARQLSFEESLPDLEAFLTAQKRQTLLKQKQEAMMRFLAELEAANQVSYKISMPNMR